MKPFRPLETALLTSVCALALMLPVQAQIRFGFGVGLSSSEPAPSSFAPMPAVVVPPDNTPCNSKGLAQEFAQMEAAYKKLGLKLPYSQKTKALAIKSCGNRNLADYKAYVESAQADIRAMTKIPPEFLSPRKNMRPGP